MRAYQKAFAGVACPLYKDVFTRLVGNDRMGLPNDAMFQGWHTPACQAEAQFRDAMDNMLFAFWQAKTYAKAMQRNKRGAS